MRILTTALSDEALELCRRIWDRRLAPSEEFSEGFGIKDIPRQMNDRDSGVYMCKFAEFASRRASIVFTQEHMPYYRQRMV
ncbi:Sentrin-specific protease 2, partial [Parelaphostrongylus tenuis]